MANYRKYRLLLIEPSEIIAAGFMRIVEHIDGFFVASCCADVSLAAARMAGVDAVVIDPCVLSWQDRLDVRSLDLFSPDMPIVAIAADSAVPVPSQYDAVIALSDSVAMIEEKLRSVASNPEKSQQRDNGELSARERSILKAVAQGKTNKRIAEEFNLSVNTIVTHRKNISHKLGINTISGLTAYAIINKIIDIDSLG